MSQALCLVQAQKLGIVGPQTDAPLELIQALQTMWADNGDAISRQVWLFVLVLFQIFLEIRLFIPHFFLLFYSLLS